ncbi:TNT domain-containing protein [Micromonospora vulcania]|uniref:TNT domain-containing protein n=1 Tax=Micromonospora vulcania TaxID=1441873 RepID=A0ABW1HB59_9ACTN
MKRRRWLIAVLSGAALILLPAGAHQIAAPIPQAQATALNEDPDGPGGPRSPAARSDDQPQPPPQQTLCRPGLPPNAPATSEFLDNNRLLGPAQLPAASPVGPLLAGYQRFGVQTEAQFLARYTAGSPASFLYPPQQGYVLDPNGAAIKNRQTMLAGYRLDRFGFPGGAFLAPLGTPFGARSLPPQNLNTPPPRPGVPPAAPLANYHTYCVLKAFDVDSGPIAPWFAQPGLGTQFQLNPAYLPQAGATLSVQWLIDNHFLVEEYLGGDTPACTADAMPRQGGLGGGVPIC